MEEWVIKTSILTKAISKCKYNIMFKGILCRNINIPNISMQQLRTLNSQRLWERTQLEASYSLTSSYRKELWVTTAERNWHKHRLQENREARNKPMCMWTVSSWKPNQEGTKGKGQSSQETAAGKLDTLQQRTSLSSSPSHRNLTKTPAFSRSSSFSPESSAAGPAWPAPSCSQETSPLSSVFPLPASSLVGTESALLLSAWMRLRYPEPWWVSRQSSVSRAWSQVWGQNVTARAGGGWVRCPLHAAKSSPQMQRPDALLRALSSETQTEMEPTISTTLLKIITWNN